MAAGAGAGGKTMFKFLNYPFDPSIVNDFIFTVSEEGFLIVIDSKSGKIIRSTDVFDKFKIKKRKKIA